MKNKIIKYIRNTFLGVIIAGVVYTGFVARSDVYNKEKQKEFIKNKADITHKYNIASLHMHSVYSDRIMGIEELVNNSIKEDYSIIAVSDYNNNDFNILESCANSESGFNFDLEKINGYTLKIIDSFDNDNDNKKDIVYLLKASEIMAKEGVEVLGIGYTNKPDSYQPLENIINELKEQDALIMAPHPAVLILGGMGEENIKKYADSLDGIEINGSIPVPACYFYNKKAEEWSKKYNIPLVSNSDAHLIGIYFNTYATLISKENFDENNLNDYIRKNLQEGKYRLIQFKPESLRLHPWVINIILKNIANIQRFSAKLKDFP